MRADHPRLVGNIGADLSNRDGGGVGAEDRGGLGLLAEILEDRALDLELLGPGLEDEIGIGHGLGEIGLGAQVFQTRFVLREEIEDRRDALGR